MPGKRVLSIGQCAADHWAISRTLQLHFDADVTDVDSVTQALQQLNQQNFDLILVNRLLDSDGSSGLEVIRTLASEPGVPSTPIMLVSNYPDAQQQAVQIGAVPGFGKASLMQPAMLAAVKPFLG